MGYGAAERPAIDIEEFERRLRGPVPRSGDPLAELARLVTPADANPQALDRMFAARPNGAPPIDHAALEAELRQSFAGGGESFHGGHFDHDGVGLEGSQSHDPAYAAHGSDTREWLDEGDYQGHMPVPEAARPRSKRPLYATAAVIAVGLLGITGTLAFKGRGGGSGEIADIKASTSPIKVQGPAANSTASADTSVMDRAGGTQAVSRAVERQERPVDVRDAARNPRGSSITSSNPIAALSGVDTDGATFAEPRKVKTVSVKPDGTIVSSTTASVPRQAAAAAAPQADTTSATKSATPKAVSRAATTPKPVADATDTKPDGAKPAKVASRTKPARDADDDAPDAAPAAPAARSTGGFAVQLAAPGSESDAKAQASRLSQKYSDALGGARLTVKKADDKDVFRVRTAGMSREDAVAACEKVKAAGGGCFVSKN